MDRSSIVQTRRALHVVAELVLAVPQHRGGGGIKLQVCPGGFRTRSAPDLRVEGVDLADVAAVLSFFTDGKHRVD